MDNYNDVSEDIQENNKKKSGIFSYATKMGWKKLPLKVKLIIVGIATSVIFLLVIIILIASLFSLESVNSTEVAGSKRYNSNTTNQYERDVIEFQENNNITEFVDLDEEQVKAHEMYYDALFQAYEQYKANNGEPNIFGVIGGLFEKVFSSKKNAPLLTKSGDKPYGVQVDTSLISTTLYNSRFYGDMLFEDKQDAYYFEGSSYYDLHSTGFRDSVENDYFKQAREGESSGKITIEGIEILAKYMIQRVETYYTLQKEYEGIYYDTTRHIKIVNTYIDMGQCRSYVNDNSSIVFDHYRIGGGKYNWKANVTDECRDSYNINSYDDAKYNNVGKDGFANQYSSGYEYLNYELDCDGYQKYLLTEYPLVNDDYGNNQLEMFCDGKAECYNDFFIPSYYYKYVDADKTSDKRVQQIEDIVFNTYSLLEYYESSTLNFNVCRIGQNSGTVSYGDYSCGVVDPSGTILNFDTVTGDVCNLINMQVRLVECSNVDKYGESSFPGGRTVINGSVVSAGTISFAEYIKTVAIGEIYASDPIEALKFQMLISQTFTLGQMKTRIKVVGNELWIPMQSNCFQAYHYYKYHNLSGEYKSKVDAAYNAISNKAFFYKESNNLFPALYGNKGQEQFRGLARQGFNYSQILENFRYSKDGVSYSKAEIRQCGGVTNVADKGGNSNAMVS